jgi:single-strand DNA-binding protein
MNDLNSVVLVGRLTRDAELKTSRSGMPFLTFSIAVNRSVKRGDQWTDEGNFFDVTLFGKLGAAIGKYMVKGTRIGVQGELKQDRWQDQAGNNRSRVQIIANTVNLLGGGEKTGGGRSAGSPDNFGGSGGGPDDFEDDIPF